MKNLNRFARQQVIREFPFLAELPTGLQFHNADEFSVRRMDEGLLRSCASEYSWRDQGDCLHDDTKFFFVNGGKFSGSVSVDSMVAEALTELPDFVLEFRYRDINRSDYRLELILWKRPKDAQLLQNVVSRLREEAQAELAGEISAVNRGTDAKFDAFVGSVRQSGFHLGVVSVPTSQIPEKFDHLALFVSGTQFLVYADDLEFGIFANMKDDLEADNELITFSYRNDWEQHDYFTVLGMKLVKFSTSYGWKGKDEAPRPESHEYGDSVFVYVPKRELQRLKEIFFLKGFFLWEADFVKPESASKYQKIEKED